MAVFTFDRKLISLERYPWSLDKASRPPLGAPAAMIEQNISTDLIAHPIVDPGLPGLQGFTPPLLTVVASVIQ